MKEIVTNGLRFNGMGYAVLSRNKLQIKPPKTEIIFDFKTFSEYGLLMYMSDYARDFLSLELKEGRVVFQYDLGGNVAFYCVYVCVCVVGWVGGEMVVWVWS
jgi:hypothetical protein